MKQLTFIFLLVMIICGCDLYQQDSYQEYYVVEAYMIANAPLPQVRLTTSGSIDDSYCFREETVSGAQVEIRRLERDSTVAETYRYREITPGFYYPLFRNRVQPRQMYQLYITAPDGTVIESTTNVPGEVTIVGNTAKEYHYQQDQQIQISTTTGTYPGRQSFFVFSVQAVSPRRDALTPFYRNMVEEQDSTLSNLEINSSGIINEANFQEDRQGVITLPVPWLSIAFVGQNNIIINAIDDNLYDFLRSQSAQTGVGTLAPGEIQNITYNIDGGIGIFGALANDTVQVNILPQQD